MSFWDWLWGPSSPETHVSSTSYNLSGDYDGRTNYRNVLAVQNVLSNDKKTMSEGLTAGYLGGPGIKFRSYFRWADNHYDYIGMPTGSLSSNASINMTTLAEYVPHEENEIVWLQDGELGIANYTKWIEQWFLENHPEEIDSVWSADISGTTITLNRVGDITEVFTATNFNKDSNYIYGYYSLVTLNVAEDVVVGDVINLAPSDPLPSLDGWTLNNTVTESLSVNLDTITTTTINYSDATPTSISSSTVSNIESYSKITKKYIKEVYLGNIDLPGGGKGIRKTLYTMWITEDKEISNDISTTGSSEVISGVTVTTIIDVNEEILINKNSYRLDEQVIYLNEYSSLKLFIYRIGSGITDLDNAIQVAEEYGKFYPFLPIRLNNNFLSPSYYPTAYDLVDESYKKITRSEVSSLIDTLASNAFIGDMDYIFVVLGISLNTKDKSELKYLYRFFRKLMISQSGGPSIYADWIISNNIATAQKEAWELWYAAQSIPSDPLYNTPEPPRNASTPTLTSNQIRITNTGSVPTNYDIRINWFFIGESSGSGLGKIGAKKGDLWFEHIGNDEFNSAIINNASGSTVYNGIASIEKIRLYNQVNANSYTYLDIVGLNHLNYIYNGKYVGIGAVEALNDSKESGFIIPLHYLTYKELSIVDSTQISLSCVHLVINSYKVVTKEWWESGFFQIIIVVVIAVLSVLLLGPAGIGSIGILGANLAVGTALGFTGLTAAIVGSVANALAAMILVQIITSTSIAIFGQEIGSTVAIVLSFLVMQSATNFQQTGSIALNWNHLMKVDNLMLLLDSVGEGYSAFIKNEVDKLAIDSNNLIENAKSDLEKIEKNYYNEFGYGLSSFKPMTLTDTLNSKIESSDTFLTRTLMTGTDISDMSMNMLTDFADLTLKLPDAYN